ncbi:MAG: high frequency lysogenization protein HflD [Gammaproteobacteria bacterium]|nr:high frequency lysogenization protein HflD [Gammaproteobacteria bacterium]
MQHSKRDQVIAIAGVFQAASLVEQIANKGMVNSAVIESSIESLFRFDVESAESVFGNLAGVGTGLRVLDKQIGAFKNERNLEITQYAISMIALEKKLSANPEMLEKISKGLNEIHSTLEFFSLMHENIFAKIGSLYKETISTLQPQIVVQGERVHLGNESNANKVRALLLAGIRAAVLWRQCGGSRWHILFGRKRYVEECRILLAEL